MAQVSPASKAGTRGPPAAVIASRKGSLVEAPNVAGPRSNTQQVLVDSASSWAHEEDASSRGRKAWAQLGRTPGESPWRPPTVCHDVWEAAEAGILGAWNIEVFEDTRVPEFQTPVDSVQDFKRNQVLRSSGQSREWPAPPWVCRWTTGHRPICTSVTLPSGRPLSNRAEHPLWRARSSPPKGMAAILFAHSSPSSEGIRNEASSAEERHCHRSSIAAGSCPDEDAWHSYRLKTELEGSVLPNNRSKRHPLTEAEGAKAPWLVLSSSGLRGVSTPGPLCAEHHPPFGHTAPFTLYPQMETPSGGGFHRRGGSLPLEGHKDARAEGGGRGKEGGAKGGGEERMMYHRWSQPQKHSRGKAGLSPGSFDRFDGPRMDFSRYHTKAEQLLLAFDEGQDCECEYREGTFLTEATKTPDDSVLLACMPMANSFFRWDSLPVIRKKRNSSSSASSFAHMEVGTSECAPALSAARSHAHRRTKTQHLFSSRSQQCTLSDAGPPTTTEDHWLGVIGQMQSLRPAARPSLSFPPQVLRVERSQVNEEPDYAATFTNPTSLKSPSSVAHYPTFESRVMTFLNGAEGAPAHGYSKSC